MSRLLPGRPDPTTEDREPTMLALDDDRADEVFDALGSETARTILQSLHGDPRPASELTDEVGTTLQNVQYHLTKLQAADLVTVVDTWYGENGAEMDVYAPTDEALVLFAGEDPESSLRTLLGRFVGVFGLLALGALVVAIAASRFRESEPAHFSSGSPNASSDYTVAFEPIVPDPLLVAMIFVAGGLVALAALLAIGRIRSA
ncbi:ArsR family transcriptional regulator [Halorhabdus sp. CBA1104]|uniref:ArsR/SmtB family transcription factor n=1 Tax=unclassified Halorhabdus TaxID=2621901 RepID=UPI0012B22A73|nr:MULTISPECIES: helix-turn-helix domain-containing protein [unclassified Halorhabdus]QGN07506.1 ArsR family transcriptional regulator [Halorhabdus sp. CBA1104]